LGKGRDEGPLELAERSIGMIYTLVKHVTRSDCICKEKYVLIIDNKLESYLLSKVLVSLDGLAGVRTGVDEPITIPAFEVMSTY